MWRTPSYSKTIISFKLLVLLQLFGSIWLQAVIIVFNGTFEIHHISILSPGPKLLIPMRCLDSIQGNRL